VEQCGSYRVKDDGSQWRGAVESRRRTCMKVRT
jgi:hypothetical protein